jgi:hypothetical protein
VNRFYVCLAAGGCALSFDATQLGVPATMASAAQTPAEGTPFRVNRHPVFIGWGAFTVGAPRIEDVIAGQVGTGGGVAQLRIKVRARWSDLLITALTAGLFSPRTVTVEGVVVSQRP